MRVCARTAPSPASSALYVLLVLSVEKIVADLVRIPAMANARRVLLNGLSAGALGLASHADFFNDAITAVAPAAIVKAHFEAGFYPIFGKDGLGPADGKAFYDFFPVQADFTAEVMSSDWAAKVFTAALTPIVGQVPVAPPRGNTMHHHVATQYNHAATQHTMRRTNGRHRSARRPLSPWRPRCKAGRHRDLPPLHRDRAPAKIFFLPLRRRTSRRGARPRWKSSA
jgi:hypothetical protein